MNSAEIEPHMRVIRTALQIAAGHYRHMANAHDDADDEYLTSQLEEAVFAYADAIRVRRYRQQREQGGLAWHPDMRPEDNVPGYTHALERIDPPNLDPPRSRTPDEVERAIQENGGAPVRSAGWHLWQARLARDAQALAEIRAELGILSAQAKPADDDRSE
jgi:hypothetical protein